MKNVISMAAVVILAMTASVAFACDKNPPPHCSCGSDGQWHDRDTGKVVNTVTNNNTNINNNNSVNKSTNVNGVNGNVGSTSSATAAGGSATATGGSATGGSVSNSGNSTATGGTQKQSQTQTQSNSLTNSGNATTGASTSSASADGAGANSNNTTIETNYKAAKIPVATAYSAGLTSGFDTCLGSASGGVQTGIVGLTFGSTKVDKNCVTIKRTHLVAEFSIPAGCDYMLKHVPDAADSFKAVGAKCIPDPVVTVAPDAVTHQELREVENRIVTKVVKK